MTKDQIIAEVETLLSPYADVGGLIDPISLDRYITNCLKEFGGNAMDACEEVIPVKNYKAQLPEDFYSLVIALKCDMIRVDCPDEETKRHLQDSFFYKERTEHCMEFTNTFNRPHLKGEDCKLVREEIYFHDKTKKVKFQYDNIKKLKCVRDRKNDRIQKDCKNLFWDCPNQISIRRNYIQTNFKTGSIYLRFKGLPKDDEGNIVLPEIGDPHLGEWIIYYCIKRIMESLLLSNDADIVNKLSYFSNRERETYMKAQQAIASEGMAGWAERVKRQNRRRFMRFECQIPNL